MRSVTFTVKIVVDASVDLLSLQGDPSMSVDHLYQVDFDMLTHDFQTSLKVCVCSLLIISLTYSYSLSLTQSFTSGLSRLLESLDMQEEIFSLGSTSRFIANQLSNLPAARTRRKVESIKI